MKKKALYKDIRQEIKRTFPKFLSLFLMSALGVSFFSGVRASMPDMLSTTDRYFKEAELFDIQAVSTMGLQEEDLEAVLELPEVKEAELSYTADLLCDRDGEQYVVHVMSESEMARCKAKEGRLPQKENEIFLDTSLAEMLDCGIGDKVTLYSEEEEQENSGLKREKFTVVGIGSSPMYLSMDRGSASVGNGQVTGFAVVTPEAFDMEVYTQISVRLHDTEGLSCYSDEYKELVEKAQKKIEETAKGQCQWRYEQIYGEASEEIADAREELEDARQEAERELLDGRRELSDGWAQVQDGEKKLAEGKQQLKDSEAQIASSEKELSDAKTQLSQARLQAEEGETQIQEGWKEIEEQEAVFKQAEEEFKKGQEEYEQGKALLEVGRAQIEQGENKLVQGKAELEEKLNQEQSLIENKQKLEAGILQLSQSIEALQAQVLAIQGEIQGKEEELSALEEGTPEYEVLWNEIQEFRTQEQGLQGALQENSGALETLKEQLGEVEAGLNTLNQQREELEKAKAELAKQEEIFNGQKAEFEAKEAELGEAKERIEKAQAELSEGRARLEKGKEALNQAQEEVSAGKAQIAAYERQIAEGESRLAEGKRQIKDAKARLPEQEQKLIDAKKELEEGEKEYQEGKQEAEEKISDGETQISDAQKELEDLEKPEWYVRDREDTVEDYGEMEDNAGQIGEIGKVFPLMFFLVAALVSLTTMTRMVEEQRGHIGTMKALGYKKSDIAKKYLWYAGSATLGGGALGIILGQKLFPYIIQVSYGIMYDCLKQPYIPYRIGSALQALGISFACIMAATALSCMKELKELPAELMRPEAPKVGKRVLLEYLPFIWKRLNFTTKSTFRNLFRYKKRLFMTIFGISATMALLVTGFGLRDSIIDLAEIQYDNIQLYDAMVTLNGTEEEKTDFNSWIREQDKIHAATMVHMEMLEAKTDQGSGEVYLCVPENAEDFQEMTILKNRTTKRVYTLEEQGVLLTEWMSDTLKVKEGDTIALQEEDGEPVEVKVSGIVENYIMNYVYMTPSLYEKLYGEEVEYQVMYVELTEQGREQEQSIGKAILQEPGVYNVSYTSDRKEEINDMLQALVLVVIVLIVTAALLAYVVLYNLNNVNITERRRELATLKVLGFYDKEVAAYVYHENIILTLIGIVAGIFLGTFLHQYIIHTIRVDMVMFGQHVSLISFCISGILTAVFSAFVNFVMYFKLKEINMVESLKSVE